MPHVDAVLWGAGRYVDRLAHVAAAKPRTQLAEVAGRLRQTIAAAIAHRGALSEAHVLVTAADFAGLGQAALRFVNEWAPGLGNPDAPIIAMGTEHAYTIATDSINFTLENCAIHALWLAEGGPDPAPVLAAPGEPHAFQRSPQDWYQIRDGRHTWSRLSYVVGQATGEAPSVLMAPRPQDDIRGARLFDRVYLVEQSALAARQRAQGAAVVPLERRQFLRRLLAELPNARALLMYGQVPQAPELRRELGTHFLGLDADSWLHSVHEEYVKGKVIKWCAADGRVVILSHAVTASVTNDYRGRVGEIIAKYM